MATVDHQRLPDTCIPVCREANEEEELQNLDDTKPYPQSVLPTQNTGAHITILFIITGWS